LCYISAGASLFCVSHGWSYVDSFFFCFAALGTIGIVENNQNEGKIEAGGPIFVLVNFKKVSLPKLSTVGAS
jgi:hypothetical protein